MPKKKEKLPSTSPLAEYGGSIKLEKEMLERGYTESTYGYGKHTDSKSVELSTILVYKHPTGIFYFFTFLTDNTICCKKQLHDSFN